MNYSYESLISDSSEKWQQAVMTEDDNVVADAAADEVECVETLLGKGHTLWRWLSSGCCAM